MWLAPSGECRQRVLDGGRAALAGADADGFLDRADEDLAVADASGVGRLLNGLHRALDQLVLQDDLDFYLEQEIDDVFGAAVELGVALLAAEALGLGHRDALDADLVQRFLNLVQLERLDDRFDLLHRVGGACLSAGDFYLLVARPADRLDGVTFADESLPTPA